MRETLDRKGQQNVRRRTSGAHHRELSQLRESLKQSRQNPEEASAGSSEVAQELRRQAKNRNEALEGVQVH